MFERQKLFVKFLPLVFFKTTDYRILLESVLSLRIIKA